LQAGAAVAVLDRDEAGATAIVEQGKQSRGKSFALRIDLADTPQIPAAVARVIEQLGRIDILVNCAGVTGQFQSLLEMDEENWDFVQTVNLKAAMLLMKHVARHMIQRGGRGRIVNVNAVAPGMTVTAMTRVLGDAKALEQATASGPLENLFHRVSQPEDVAEAIVFLCLPGSRQITGQTIHTSAGAVV
jgi:NAD(P)-dependent dehydrogenase (short-subunit alcohol dehydrogenase family)